MKLVAILAVAMTVGILFILLENQQTSSHEEKRTGSHEESEDLTLDPQQTNRMNQKNTESEAIASGLAPSRSASTPASKDETDTTDPGDDSTPSPEIESIAGDQELQEIFERRPDWMGPHKSRWDEKFPNYPKLTPELIDILIKNDALNPWGIEPMAEDRQALRELLSRLSQNMEDRYQSITQKYLQKAAEKAAQGATEPLIESPDGTRRLPGANAPGQWVFAVDGRTVRVDQGEFPAISDLQREYTDFRDYALDELATFFANLQ